MCFSVNYRRRPSKRSTQRHPAGRFQGWMDLNVTKLLLLFTTGRFVPLLNVSSSRQKRFAIRRSRTLSRTSPPRTVTWSPRKIVGWRPYLCQGFSQMAYSSGSPFTSSGSSCSQIVSRFPRRSVSMPRLTPRRWLRFKTDFPSYPESQVKKPVVKEWCYKPSDLRNPSSPLALSHIFRN